MFKGKLKNKTLSDWKQFIILCFSWWKINTFYFQLAYSFMIEKRSSVLWVQSAGALLLEVHHWDWWPERQMSVQRLPVQPRQQSHKHVEVLESSGVCNSMPAWGWNFVCKSWRLTRFVPLQQPNYFHKEQHLDAFTRLISFHHESSRTACFCLLITEALWFCRHI